MKATGIRCTLVALWSAILLSPSTFGQTCVSMNGQYATTNASTITLYPFGGTSDLTNEAMIAAGAAVGLWANCSNYGVAFPSFLVNQSGDIPVFVEATGVQNTVPGGGCASERNTPDPTTGVLDHARISLYSKTTAGTDCNHADGVSLAHELGHVLGLSNASGSTCSNYIMGPLSSTSRSVQPSECSAVDQSFNTSQETSGGSPTGGDTQGCTDFCCNGDCDTPIVIDLDGRGIRLTSIDDGVPFDLDANGTIDRVAWTSPEWDDAFLALDRNGNGVIDNGAELFGDRTLQPPSDAPNGFLALAVFDRPELGGNGDGDITTADAVFSSLRCWIDRNHDGVSQPEEESTLPDAGILGIDLHAIASMHRDPEGNLHRWSSFVTFTWGRRLAATDVVLLMRSGGD